MYCDKTPALWVSVIVLRDGFLAARSEEKYKQWRENKNALDPNPHPTDCILTHHIALARTRLNPGPAGHFGGVLAIQTGSFRCV